MSATLGNPCCLRQIGTIFSFSLTGRMGCLCAGWAVLLYDYLCMLIYALCLGTLVPLGTSEERPELSLPFMV
jgi:hypothetical protein